MARNIVWTAVVIAAAVAIAVPVVLLRHPPTRHTAAPPPATTAAPSPSPSLSQSPVAEHKAAPAHQRVAAAAPTTFEMKGPAFDIKAHVCAMPYVRPLDPPGEQRHTVCWVEKDLGVAPASPSTGTSYVLGHSWSQDKLEVLNPMSIRAMKQVDESHPQHESGVPIFPVTNLNGYAVRLRTANGTLTYRVTRAFAVGKEQAGNVKSVMAEHVPNRIVLITCGVRNGVDVDLNVIAYATLVSSVAT